MSDAAGSDAAQSAATAAHSASPSPAHAPGSSPSPAQVQALLRRAQAVAERAVQLGRHPFGALLVAPDHETVLMEQCNIDTVNHAESTLARVAAANYPADYLWRCTLVTSVEPYCMCAGTVYWANIGRVVFGLTEAELLQATGNHAENPTMHLPAAQVLAAGQKPIELIGPVPEVAAEVLAQQQRFWAGR